VCKEVSRLNSLNFVCGDEDFISLIGGVLCDWGVLACVRCLIGLKSKSCFF
jgi:hypothetical protein